MFANIFDEYPGKFLECIIPRIDSCAQAQRCCLFSHSDDSRNMCSFRRGYATNVPVNMFGTCLSFFLEDLFWENGSFSPANLVEMFPMISSIGLKCVPKNMLSLKLWSGIVCLDISLRFVTACIFLKLLKRARFVWKVLAARNHSTLFFRAVRVNTCQQLHHTVQNGVKKDSYKNIWLQVGPKRFQEIQCGLNRHPCSQEKSIKPW